MFGRRNKKEEQVDTEVNLIPIMNLFTALIPFLLLSAAFIQVKVINGSVPAIADGSDPVNEQQSYDKRPVVVNVQITNKGYEVSASGDDLSKKELDALKRTFKLKKRKHDVQTLRRYLSAVKKKHPKSDTIIIVPDNKVKYAQIVRVMDVSRELPGKKEDGSKRYLFPKVVVASLHQ